MRSPAKSGFGAMLGHSSKEPHLGPLSEVLGSQQDSHGVGSHDHETEVDAPGRDPCHPFPRHLH